MSTPGTLIINASSPEIRVALLEGGVPVEVFIERHEERGVVGNIYRGKVVRVLPGMQAAFVEIGLDRTAFLYVNDALLTPPPSSEPASAEDGEGNHDGEPTAEAQPETRKHQRMPPVANISDILRERQDIIVQVQKEPLGTKGARLTRQVSIPGRHLVFLPFSSTIGVSHRIEDPNERDRLKKCLGELIAAGGGFIVRTAAEGIEEARLEREARMLIQMWTDLERRAKSGPSPQLLLEDLELVLRVTRDLFTEDVERIVVDTQDAFDKVYEFVKGVAPGSEERVKLHDSQEPIFDHFGVEVEIARALDQRVWLKSGGYIVIDQTEALTVVDVNSGRFVGKSSLEDTITQINLEAVKETAYQLRLRNIGGIIIIDFIDMAEQSNREKILDALEAALTRDRAKSSVVRMSEIGLVEMTRKRVRESLGKTLNESCPYCKGRAFIKSPQTVANEILRAIQRTLAKDHAQALLINMHPELADYLYEEYSAEIERIEEQRDTRIVPIAREGFHREQFEIVLTQRFG